MTDHAAPIKVRKIEITAKITRATGEVEHVKLKDGKWEPISPDEQEPKQDGADDQGH